jgi:PKD repeat protein
MNYRLILSLHLLLLLCYQAAAQCNPSFGSTGKTTDTFCVGEIFSLNANSPGYTDSSTSWSFGDGNQSISVNTSHSYANAGNYTITFTSSGTAGSCTKTLSVTIKNSPDIDISLQSLDSQCFQNNSFCIYDQTTAPFGKVSQTRYVFSDGNVIDTINPVFPVNICKVITDPNGGYFDMVAEAKDTNGCVSREVYRNFLYVSPKIDISLVNATPTNPDCDSTLGRFRNTSITSLEDLDSFCWFFGDGDSIVGTPTSNTQYWTGNSGGRLPDIPISTIPNVIQHTYDLNGNFDATLIGKAFGCSDTFTLKNAVSVVSIPPPTLNVNDIYTIDEMPVCFTVSNPSGLAPTSFFWNFGDPPSGNLNFNTTTLNPCRNFELGPHLVTLRIQIGPCSFNLIDTFQVLGPDAQIEADYNRIGAFEKNQCGTADSIHFTNASTFYHNDNNPTDEDSTVIINGKSQLAFNYNSSTSLGDQTALTSSTHLANRTMGSQVWRIWDFGDAYAPQCTTSNAKGLNVGINCNFSEDEFPVHKYQSWDSIYYNNYYAVNDSFQCTNYNESTNSCYVENIDTLNASKHRELFDETISREYRATLWLRDTINQREDTDEVMIDLRKPDASKMTLSSGTPCPFYGGNFNYQLEFDMNAGGKSYFAVNFDSLAYGVGGFTPYNQGILAPPKPGNPTPFLLPYAITGGLGDKFVKGYSPGEIGDPNLRSPHGAFTMGLIVGKGPLSGGVPSCLDTAWYPNIFNIPYLNSGFDIVDPEEDKKYICAGESAYFKLDESIQHNISTLRWNWGYQGLGEGPDLDLYVEEFKYAEKYNGPSPTRNDKDILYAGEDWLYNYVVRSTIDEFSGFTTLDTIVTSILKDWKSESVFENEELYNTFSQTLGCTDIPKEQMYKLWGDGTFGCIDTTGLSEFLKVVNSEYRNYNGDAVYMVQDKRYRYTNASHTDSIEVAQVLHFRDSSLQGYDTLILGTDTTHGVWKKEYNYRKVIDGDTVTLLGKGSLNPSLSITTLDGCQSSHSEILNAGFHAYFSLSDQLICKGLTIGIYDSIRYYQYGVEDPFTYPLNQNLRYWNSPIRYSANPPLETFIADWDKNDGHFDSIRSLPLFHFYYDPGEYIMTIVAEDSMGCTDTTEFEITISDAAPDFNSELGSNCESLVTFTDLSTVASPLDEIISWEWDFGDGTRNSILQNPTHKYSVTEGVDVTLTTKTKTGCDRSITKQIIIPGPRPKFEFTNWIWFNDTVVICQGDSLELKNISRADITSPIFQMIWGDGSVSSAPGVGETFSHRYNTPGIYELFLTVEDEIPGTGVRCSRIFPDTNPDLITQRRIVVIVHESPEVSITTSGYPSYLGQFTMLTANLDQKYTRIRWIMGDGTVYDEPDVSQNTITHQFTQEGIYNVILAPEYDELPRCWARDTSQVWVRHDSLISVTELDLGIAIYPNPAGKRLYIKIDEGVDITSLQIIDILGKEYETKYLSKNVLDVATLASGTYILRLETSKGLITKKIQVLRE